MSEVGNRYRTHTCTALRPEHVGERVRLSGWVHRKRDHGQLLFIDLRDHYGVTQCVFTPESAAFTAAETVRLESVISVLGAVIRRTEENVNPALPTGLVEVTVETLEVLSTAETLPFQDPETIHPLLQRRRGRRGNDPDDARVHHNAERGGRRLHDERAAADQRGGHGGTECPADDPPAGRRPT